jgi:hypothetical protein
MGGDPVNLSQMMESIDQIDFGPADDEADPDCFPVRPDRKKSEKGHPLPPSIIPDKIIHHREREARSFS